MAVEGYAYLVPYMEEADGYFIRLSSPDLRDLRARALEEGVPYQTLIASVLHKFVAGRLVDRPARSALRPTRPARKRAAG